MKKEKRLVQIGIRLTKTMKNQLKEIADADERTVASMTYKIIKEYLEQNRSNTVEHDK